ncbi:hypothetical protein C9374_006084 [Naegleria lovaniensis]|uniref:Kinesin-like protein n=1 Tax=Naegleria lovaniensis TaxID=51637 RepID=A0AA88GK99_NAELO|nr:uncharacterized protein C9374_006084 [Naegleria lovaniensis]KAG2381700.1 hypothetical protein C9374_006084 [Naegleria lovaniensis]
MGQNIDKRSYRREHSELYMKLIQYYRDGMDDDAQSPTSSEQQASSEDVVKVFIRKRPMFERDLKAGEYDVVTCKKHDIIVHDCRMHPSMKPNLAYVESYKFPYPNTEVFNDQSSTDQVYASALKPLVDYVAGGNVGTMFCFGQTGSGKTFTITGLVKLLSKDLFTQLGKQGKFSVTATCIELIGETAYDLLSDHAEVALREGKNGEVVICGNKLCALNNGSEFNELYNYAAKLRETHATKVNSNSSRSHYICRVFIDDSATGKQFARLTLCDLAGSERNVDSNEHDIERLKETAQINSSLMALKEVIRCVALNKENEGSKVHIPFRTSKLTRVLKDCFEIDEKKKRPHTVVVATVSPLACDTEHTINTLKHTCLMMSSDSNMTGEKMVVQDVLGADPYQKKTNVLKPIAKMTYEETLEWIGSIQKGKFKKHLTKFPTSMDGKALSRFPDKRLQQILGSESLGLDLRKEIMNYTDKCNQQKKQQAEENRNLSK